MPICSEEDIGGLGLRRRRNLPAGGQGGQARPIGRLVMQSGRRGLGRLRTAILAACAAVVAGPDAAGAPTATVFYQVTGTDGEVRHEDHVPRTNKGIRHVLRITRYERAPAGSVILSTGPQPVIEVNPGRTVLHKMTWNGKAWVVERAAPRPKPAPAAAEPPKPKTDAEILAAEIRRVEAVLSVLAGRLRDLDHAAAQAQRDLQKAKGTPAEDAAQRALAAARSGRDHCVRAVEHYQAVLSALRGAAGSGRAEVGKPSGSVKARPQNGASAKAGGGVVRPVGQGRVLSHRVQVWRLPPGSGKRTYRIWMAHPEAGPLGSFYYVACADTDGDGRPDRQIARSPLAAAEQPGQWTQWEFTTSEPAVFVGNAWTNPWTQVYWQAGTEHGGNWHGLPNEVWVAPFWGGRFRKGGGWGFLTNLRYRVALAPQQLDEHPSPSTGSGIYEWEIR